MFVPDAEIRIEGTPLDPDIAAQLLEVRVETHSTLPDMFSMMLADPQLKHVDDGRFAVGKSVTVHLCASDKQVLTLVFDGQITALEPDFAGDEVVLSVRGYDRSHLLNRTRRTATYQLMSVSEIAIAVATRANLKQGRIDSTGAPPPFVQQSNETDWAFLWRLALAVGFEVAVVGEELHFRRADRPPPGSPVELEWGHELLAFRPRITGVGQVADVVVRGWDPVQRQAISVRAGAPTAATSIGIARSAVVGALGGGSITVADQPVFAPASARTLADSFAARLAAGFVEADGETLGDPRLRAGSLVRIAGVGTRFGGVYELSEATHIVRSDRGYQTRLRVVARGHATLSELAAPAEPRSTWRKPVVVGIVTNNSDPRGLGRIRVRYPTLDDTHEGWWARMTAPSAGSNRGLLMLPRPGDEVLLAFEHDDDEHPFIVGSVWNGAGRPGELAHTDGSFALRSDRQLVAKAVEQISVQGDAGVALEAGGAMTLKAQGSLTETTAADGSFAAQGSLTLKGARSVTASSDATITVDGGTSVVVKGGTQVTIEAGGQLQIKGATVQIEASASLEITANAPIMIKAPLIQLG